MEKLSMCRVCLGEDIRLVAVVGTHLQEMYESLVLMPFKTEDSRPILACYICRARLKNCYELRKSCLQSEELFTQMLSCNESEEVQLQAINNKKRLTTHNVIHFSVGHVLGMDADSVGVEDLKCEVKDDPNDDEDTSEDVLEENSISDDVLPADSDKKNQESMEHEVDADSVGVETLVFLCDVKDEQSDREDTNEDVLEENSSSDDVLPAGSDKKNQESMEREVDADSVGVETLVILCDVKDEQSDREDIGAYILEENGVSANMKSEDLDDDFLINVKEEQIGNKTSDPTPKEPTQDVQRGSEDSTSSNLNGREFVQYAFKILHEVTAPDIIDSNKEITVSVQYACDTCQQCYNSKRELERHVCLCSNVWQKDLSRMTITNHTRDRAKTYMRTHTGENPYHCDICKKQFSQKSTFTAHRRKHTGEKPYHCDICKKQFTQKSNLKTHMRKHTGEKPYRCDICEKQFSHESRITEHRRIHTGEKPYHCDICKKQFSQNGHLTRHMRTHTSEKPYLCDIGKKQFSRKSSFTAKIHTHTDEKPYHCDICKKQFSNKYSLTKHMRTHTGEKPYRCDICKKKFLRKNNFTTHNNMRTHTGEKPYLCDLCKKQFSDPSPVFKRPSDGFLKTYSVLARRRQTASDQLNLELDAP